MSAGWVVAIVLAIGAIAYFVSAALLAVCREAGGRVGFKAAGGIRTARDAAGYLHLADAIMGSDWVGSRTFRFGASSLLDELLGQGGAAAGY